MSSVFTLFGTMQNYAQFRKINERTPLREHFSIIVLVVVFHSSVLAGYWLQSESPAVLVNEMSISFANMDMPQAAVVPKPQQKPREVEHEPIPSETPVIKEVTPVPVVQPVQQTTSAPSPVQLDAEPDYKADYLNNPRPQYPMVARRMGYSGKVILDVEVLAEGRAGDVKLQKSSGFEILDKAALQTVKTWRFIPAKHFGQPVTQRFLVPIKFSLEGNDA